MRFGRVWGWRVWWVDECSECGLVVVVVVVVGAVLIVEVVAMEMGSSTMTVCL